MDRIPQTPEDRVLWTLVSQGGKAARSYLRRRARLKLAELEPVLAALEREKKITRTNIEQSGWPDQVIRLECLRDWP